METSSISFRLQFKQHVLLCFFQCQMNKRASSSFIDILRMNAVFSCRMVRTAFYSVYFSQEERLFFCCCYYSHNSAKGVYETFHVLFVVFMESWATDWAILTLFLLSQFSNVLVSRKWFFKGFYKYSCVLQPLLLLVYTTVSLIKILLRMFIKVKLRYRWPLGLWKELNS